jgi:hypothetical protein
VVVIDPVTTSKMFNLKVYLKGYLYEKEEKMILQVSPTDKVSTII